MFAITTMFKPAAIKFITSKWSSLAGLDCDVSIVDIDYDSEENAGMSIVPQFREMIAGADAEALHEFLKETPHF
jgi:hypothetical protein